MKYLKVPLILMAIGVFVGLSLSSQAQTLEEYKKQQRKSQQQFKKEYKESIQKIAKERDNAIKKMDKEFAAFLKKEWENYTLFKGEIRKPEPKPIERPIYKKAGAIEPKELKIILPKTIETGVETPRLPIMSKSTPKNHKTAPANFNFYGAKLNFDFDLKTNKSFPKQINEENIAKQWDKIRSTNYNRMLGALLNYKTHMNLNDWGYYLLIKNASEQIATDKNMQVFLQWFYLTKSNYKARLAFKDTNLYLLVPSSNNIYGLPFFTFNSLRYYLINGNENDLFTYDKDFPEARIVMDLNLHKALNTVNEERTKQVKFTYDGVDHVFDIAYNQNTIDFYKDYPLADIEVYFDAVIAPQTKESLTDNLLPLIKDLPEEEATMLLLKFVQNAFEYQTDQQQFGEEKFFFPDELFHYKASDCEDRSVLFAYLSKELLGLDVIGLNYPGHMATAVKFNSNIVGDYIDYKGEKYVVCDPTFVGAPIGQTMPQFVDNNAIVVELKSSENLIGRGRKLWRLANKKGLYQGGNGNNIVFDEDKNAYLTGYFKGKVNFYGHVLESKQNSNDVFVAKISPENEVDYAFKIGSSGNDIAYNITLGKDNSLYFTGSFNKDIQVGSRTLHVKNNGDVFLAKCSRNGQLNWINQAGIEQLDSVNNMFVAHFDKNGKKLWTRVYEESEDYTDYGITIDEAGKAFITASLVASAGLDVSTKSYESYTGFDPVTTLKEENDKFIRNNYDQGIAGLFAVLQLINNTGQSLPGKQAQEALDKYNPNFRKKSPAIYKNIGKIEFIKNSQGIVTIKTNDGKDVSFNAVKVKNNSKIKVALFNSGNAQIDILSGIKVGKTIVWYDLNFIRLFKTSGDLMFDYDNDHSQKKLNLSQDILY